MQSMNARCLGNHNVCRSAELTHKVSESLKQGHIQNIFFSSIAQLYWMLGTTLWSKTTPRASGSHPERPALSTTRLAVCQERWALCQRCIWSYSTGGLPCPYLTSPSSL
uniref:Uncharacterized protein n=1 Tax=Eutreptiella gymnastica TaxID=73025 RepID=A0A7S1I8T9_9EUGL|mmetsp:Transcript_139329/g.242241  ORF Transcript_139329/g.242241 Transcript_139329/m.242241 type:complete len:109 (+) Transcript_139329:506-832(+)